MKAILSLGLPLILAGSALADGNPAFDDPSSIFFHARKGNLDAVIQALAATPEAHQAKDQLARTPLFYAAKAGHAKVVNLLLKQKDVETDALDEYGFSAMHWAAMYGHLEVLRVMGKHKLNFNLRGEDGKTPLHIAPGNGFSNAHGRHAEVVELLLSFGADPALVDDSKRTPLFTAFTLIGRLDAAEALLADPRVDVNARGRNGETVLHNAVGVGNAEAVELLLKHGADPTIEDADGKRPADRLNLLERANRNPKFEVNIRKIRELLPAG